MKLCMFGSLYTLYDYNLVINDLTITEKFCLSKNYKFFEN